MIMLVFFFVVTVVLSILAITKRVFRVVPAKVVLSQQTTTTQTGSSNTSDRCLAWDYVPSFFTGPTYCPPTIQSPHRHQRSCVVMSTSSISAEIRSNFSSASVSPIDQIADVGVLEKNGNSYRIFRHGIEGWVSRENLCALMRFNSTNHSKTKLRQTHDETSPFVKTEHGAFVEIPNSSLVAIISVNGMWAEVACVINGVKYTGFVRLSYLYEATF